MGVGVGARAPTFTVADSDNQMVDLASLLSQGPIVLAFYPKAQTSGCTQEMTALVQQTKMLKRHKAQVLAISRDSAPILQQFKKQLKAPFAFIPDGQGTLMRLYNCKMPVVTVAKRKIFIINQKGVIVHTAEGQDAIALKGVEQALAALSMGQTHTP